MLRQDHHRRAEGAVEGGVALAALVEGVGEEAPALLGVVVVVGLLVAEDRREDLEVGGVGEGGADVVEGEVGGPIDEVDEVVGAALGAGAVLGARVVVEGEGLRRVRALGVELHQVLELLEGGVAVGVGALAVGADHLLEGLGEDGEAAEAGGAVVDEVADEVGEGEEGAGAGAAGDREVDEDLERRAGVAHAVGVAPHVGDEGGDLGGEVADLDRAVEGEAALDADLAGAGAALLAEAVPGVDPLGEVGVGVGEALAAAALRVGDLVEVGDEDGLVDAAVVGGAFAEAREVGVVGVDGDEADQAAVLVLEVGVGLEALGDPADGLAAGAAEADEEGRGDFTRHDPDGHGRSPWVRAA